MNGNRPDPPPGVEILAPDHRLQSLTHGPGGRPVIELVSRGERAAKSLEGIFTDFLKRQLVQLEHHERNLDAADEPTRKQALQGLVALTHDLRGTSGSFGHVFIGELCRSLHRLCTVRVVDERKRRALVRSHIDAIQLALARNLRSLENDAQRVLLEELVTATAVLIAPDESVKRGLRQ